jgi:Rad3-related DNA helicase
MAYLDDLSAKLQALLPEEVLMTQTSGMPDAERSAFLDSFQPESRRTALAVLGGIFSEGIDLPGDRLVGVTVIGMGLPRLSLERDILQAYFEEKKGSGFDYAYRFPGMQRVLQASGRLIRTETDKGSALLVDQRFLEPRHQILFPSWWRISQTIKP